MEPKNKLKNDNRILGFMLGIVVPIVTFTLFYLYRNPESFKIFYDQVLTVNIISRLASLCVIPNLAVFFIFLQTHRYKSAHGVIGATFVYAFVVLVLTQM